MTPEEMQAEIESLQRQQADQKKYWLLYGYVSLSIGMALCVTALLRVATTSADPPSPTIFVVLSFLFVGCAFVTAGCRRREYPVD
jgi:FtsH-binding integral membrane protein